MAEKDEFDLGAELSSEEEGKFQTINNDNSDLVGNFAEIGKDYAGTGLSSQVQSRAVS